MLYYMVGFIVTMITAADIDEYALKLHDAAGDSGDRDMGTQRGVARQGSPYRQVVYVAASARAQPLKEMRASVAGTPRPSPRARATIFVAHAHAAHRLDDERDQRLSYRQWRSDTASFSRRSRRASAEDATRGEAIAPRHA